MGRIKRKVKITRFEIEDTENTNDQVQKRKEEENRCGNIYSPQMSNGFILRLIRCCFFSLSLSHFYLLKRFIDCIELRNECVGLISFCIIALYVCILRIAI